MAEGRGRVVERTRERTVLAAALDDAVSGRGSVLLLTGEGGIGKTTLAEELATSALARGVRVARGHAWEGAGSPPLVVWQEVLEELGQSDAGAERVDSRSLLHCLRGVPGPVLVVLEDLHSADADSLRLLAQMSSRLAGLRVLVVATLREHELRNRPGAAEAVASMSSDTRRVVVPPLTADGVAELAGALLGRPPADPVLRDIIVRSDGNAFFVRELVEAAQGHEVPAGVTASVRRRVANLRGDLVALLEVCACAGREVNPVVLAALSGRSVAGILDLLGPAVAAGILEDRGSGRLRFRHALVAESLVAGLLPAQRSENHLALARATGSTRAVRAVTVAHHLVQAGALAEPAEVTAWSVLAAAQAEVAGAPLEAARHLRLAVNHTDDEVERARLLERLGHCLFNAGAHLGEAVHAFEEALAGYETAGEGRRCGIVHSRLGSHLSLYRHTSDFDRAARHFERAGTLLTAPIDRAHLLVGTSTLALLRGRPREALADSQEALRIAEHADRPALAATGRLMSGASLLALGRLREGFAALDASFSTGLIVRPTVDVQTAWHGIVAGVALDDPALARSYASRAERALEGADLPGQAQIVSDLLAPAHAIAGDVAAARTELAPVDLLGFEVQREGVVPAYAGEWDVLVPALERMLERDAAAGQGVRVAGLCWVLGWVLRLRGEHGRARAHLERGLASSCRDGRELDALRLGLELVLVEVAAGDREAAARLLQDCRTRAADEDLRGLAVRLDLAGAAVRGSGFAEVVAEADLRGLPFLAVDAIARWTEAEPRRAGELRLELERRLEALAVRGTGWEVLLGTGDGGAAATTLRLRSEGATWALGTADGQLHVRDGKGVRHLARLLASPRREWHALDLVALAEGGPPPGQRATAGHAFVDEQAKRAYRQRLRELDQLREDAERDGRADAAARAVEERDAIAAHLASAMGLLGQGRGWSDDAEKARQSVTKTLRTAVEQIGLRAPAVAEHLRVSLRTGFFCSYSPDPASTVQWDVDPSPVKAAGR